MSAPKYVAGENCEKNAMQLNDLTRVIFHRVRKHGSIVTTTVTLNFRRKVLFENCNAADASAGIVHPVIP